MDADFDRAGVFRPYQEINLYAKVSGYVKRINVDIGDRVKKGQLLAVLEVPELVAEMEHSKAAVSRSQADLKRAGDELERAKSAYEVVHLAYGRLAGVAKTQPGIVAQQELDAAQGQDRQAEAGVSAAEVGGGVGAAAASSRSRGIARRDQSMLDYAQIIAPFDGVVTQRFADTGAMVAAGISSEKQALPVLELAQNDVLRLDIPVPESVVPSIREGDSVQVHVGAMNRDFEGKIVRFSRQFDESTRTMITEIDVPNANLDASARNVCGREDSIAAPPERAVRADCGHRARTRESRTCWRWTRPITWRNARLRWGWRARAALKFFRAARRRICGGGESGGIQAGAIGQAETSRAGGWRSGAGRRKLMPTFAIKHPFFILALCLMIAVVGVVTVARMPVDLVSGHQYSRSGSRDFLCGHAAAADRIGHYRTATSGFSRWEAGSTTLNRDRCRASA